MRYLLFFVALVLPLSANAQCGDSVTVESGDTLYSIAQRCKTSVGAIVSANPSIDNPNVIYVGQRISLPGRGGPEVPAGNVQRYKVQPGEHLIAVANLFGTTLDRLLELNPGIDTPNTIEAGTVINVPGSSGRANIEISPRTGQEGESLRVLGENFPPNARIEIGAGPPASEYEIIGSTSTGGNGMFDTRVTLPDVRPNRDEYVIVVKTASGAVERKAYFDFVE